MKSELQGIRYHKKNFIDVLKFAGMYILFSSKDFSRKVHMCNTPLVELIHEIQIACK